MSDHGGHSDDRDDSWADHHEFVRHYEPFLHAVYDSVEPAKRGTGRHRLVDRLRSELRTREAHSVLDCAAGTGFPALRLARHPPAGDFEIHCTDGDRAMIDVLVERARTQGLPLSRLAPTAVPGAHGDGSGPQPADLHLDWQELDRLATTYDYVMCRGNSLAYDHSWAGETKVATTGQVADHLAKMADRVRPGGWLHVDAPWRVGVNSGTYETSRGDIVLIHEQITIGPGHRQWRVSFRHSNGHTSRFRRYSSLLTIGDVKSILDGLGFEDTTPTELDGERDAFGVIIARRPR